MYMYVDALIELLQAVIESKFHLHTYVYTRTSHTYVRI